MSALPRGGSLTKIQKATASNIPGNAETRNGSAPSKMRTDHAGGDIAESRANRNGEVKEAQDAIAFYLRIEVGEQRRREDAKGRFADPDYGVAKIQSVVAMHGCGEQREQAPKHGPGDQ